MAQIESAWGRYPGYRIDLEPYEGTARAWHGDLLLAESTSALRVLESDHVDRLYFPEADVRLELLEATEHHSVCPFKGEADYWTLTASEPHVENVIWTYRTPFDEVGGLKGYLGFYHERVRIELEERWAGDDPRAVIRNQFPTWGDAGDLVELIDVRQTGPGRFVGPPYRDRTRNVVEGGQLLAQAIVAASKAVPGQRVTSAFMTFPKAASFDAPIDVEVETLRAGRTFSTVAVRAEQEGVLRSPGLLLMDAGSPDVFESRVEMPDVPGPYESEPYDMRVTGRDLRIVDGAYSPDPDRVGPPVIYAWIRFRQAPTEAYLRQALLAQATTHWTIAAAMRPHQGFGEANAHRTLSTGIMSVSIAFHDDAPLTEWFLYANPAIWAGRGLAQGDGTIFSEDGRLMASYSVQAMIRGFTKAPGAMGMDSTNAM
jgi:acyl-CoA thioesterase II